MDEQFWDCFHLNEGCDAPAGDGDVLDAGPDDVALGHRDDVRDAVARVDDDARQRPLPHLPTRPRRRQRQHRLHSDVQTCKKDLIFT